MDRMRSPALIGLAAAVTVVTAAAVQAVTAPPANAPTGSPRVATVAACPRAPVAPDFSRVHLVADLAHVTVRDSPWRAPLLSAADQVVAGTIPAVRPSATDGGDPFRYLYDEGVALRRIAGVLGLAYATTHDPRYLDALAAQTVGASRWPDWNPGHPLDTAQVATAVALGYAWSRDRMTPAERAEVRTALVDRLLQPFACGTGNGLALRGEGSGNQTTVVATSAVLAGLAMRPDEPAWSATAVAAGTAALARTAAPDGSGRSLADGPTVEGLMYTNYAAAHVALLRATVAANPRDPAVAGALSAALPSLDALAEWNERCGKVADPNVQDGWDLYPWVDRTTALAAMAASPRSGPHVLGLLDGLQAVDRLDRAGRRALAGAGRAGRAGALRGRAGAAAVPPVQAFVSGGSATTRLYGCATHGDTYALMTGVPNDAPHAHADVGNVVVKQGEQTVLTDLGQRSYGFQGGPVWRASTKAHSTLGIAQPDGTVLQERTGSGAVAVDGADLLMTSTHGPAGSRRAGSAGSWSGTASGVHDTVTGAGRAALPLSASFLLAAPPARLPSGLWRAAVHAGRRVGVGAGAAGRDVDDLVGRGADTAVRRRAGRRRAGGVGTRWWCCAARSPARWTSHAAAPGGLTAQNSDDAGLRAG